VEIDGILTALAQIAAGLDIDILSRVHMVRCVDCLYPNAGVAPPVALSRSTVGRRCATLARRFAKSFSFNGVGAGVLACGDS